MLSEERKRLILEKLTENQIVKVAELSKLFNTTAATIRRDLEDLQSQKKLIRIHGGAILPPSTSQITPQSKLSTFHINEKKRIAKVAYPLLKNNDVILLDVSTTVLELTKLIAEGNLRNLVVITNSFSIVNVLREKEDIRIIHTGGEYVDHLNSSLGSLAENAVRNMRVEKCFLGTTGIDFNYGYSVPSFEGASMKRTMIQSSKECILLSDHTKFGCNYIGKFAEFDDKIDILVTDFVPENYQHHFKTNSTQLLLADNF